MNNAVSSLGHELRIVVNEHLPSENYSVPMVCAVVEISPSLSAFSRWLKSYQVLCSRTSRCSVEAGDKARQKVSTGIDMAQGVYFRGTQALENISVDECRFREQATVAAHCLFAAVYTDRAVFGKFAFEPSIRCAEVENCASCRDEFSNTIAYIGCAKYSLIRFIGSKLSTVLFPYRDLSLFRVVIDVTRATFVAIGKVYREIFDSGAILRQFYRVATHAVQRGAYQAAHE